MRHNTSNKYELSQMEPRDLRVSAEIDQLLDNSFSAVKLKVGSKSH